MWRAEEGSTSKLLQLCLGYFIFYVLYGVATKYFTEKLPNLPQVSQMEYLVYSTLGGSLICLLVVFIRGWYRLESEKFVQIGRVKFPFEYLYIIPSGICTAVVIPTTTLMYMLPISVMVAMVIMRGSIILISRIIDAIQIKLGILKRKVYLEEELGVIFAILAVSTHLVYPIYMKKPGEFEFLRSPAAMSILSSYLIAYFIRLYIMNYYRNTRGKGVKQDNKGFFAIEQVSASLTILIVGLILFFLFPHGKTNIKPIVEFQKALISSTSHWFNEVLAGTTFGIVAFFSVFLFMFKGRTATFSGLANRLTSLVAGTLSTLIFHYAFGGKFPKIEDWVSLIFIFIAVGFLTQAERKRVAELKLAKELS